MKSNDQDRLTNLKEEFLKGYPKDKLPDWSPGDVIAAYSDGTIVLDDGITTWNPERADEFLKDKLK